MREILFKAKRISTDEWVEGSLISNEDHSFIVEPVESSYIGYCLDCDRPYIDQFNVDPSTICQYTGLTDKNGNKIWENDIVNVIYTDKKGECHYVKNYLLTDLRNSSVIGWLDYANELEVAGNKFDNAELLEEV